MKGSGAGAERWGRVTVATDTDVQQDIKVEKRCMDSADSQ